MVSLNRDRGPKQMRELDKDQEEITEGITEEIRQMMLSLSQTLNKKPVYVGFFALANLTTMCAMEKEMPKKAFFDLLDNMWEKQNGSL